MLSDYFTEGLVALDVFVSTPEEAITQTGRLLLDEGKINEKYIISMIDNYHTLGPYFVIAPHIALPHGAPGENVKEPCVSFIRLKNPICFNNPVNDPVQFLFAVGANSGTSHLNMLKDLSRFLMNSENIHILSELQSKQQFLDLLQRKEEKA
jgi:PTS system ascorbate-specific IIA component